MDAKGILFECIKQELNEECCTLEKNNISCEQLMKLFRLSEHHDLTHIVAKVIREKISNKDIAKMYNDKFFFAIWRNEQRNYVKNQISSVFDEAKIPYIFLKGSVLCNYYPEPWMRTSCDIDVLVRQVDLNKAISVLKSEHGYSCGHKDSYDVSLYSHAGVHVELHFKLIEVSPKADKVLEQVWKRSVQKTENSYEYIMRDDMFYFYHIAHMAKHFAHGGCGIRSFIDVWILNNNILFDKEERRILLEEGGVLLFAERVEELAQVWFEKREHDHTTRLIERYILEGGSYGNLENRILIQRSNCRNGFHYVLKRVFMPYREMKFEYSILEKIPLLLPIYWVVRWCDCLNCNRFRSAIKELQLNDKITRESQNEIEVLVKTVGLEIPNR